MYARDLLEALHNLQPEDMEIVPLRAPKPFSRKSLATKFMNFWLEILWLNILLPLAVRKHKIDVLHMPANNIAPLVRIPQVCSIHDVHFMTNSKGRDPLWRTYARWHFRFAARHADKILCDTHMARTEIIELLGADEKKTEVINLGLPQREALEEDLRSVAELPPYILSVGAIATNKNFSSLVKAFSELVKSGKNGGHKLIIAGPPACGHSEVIDIIHQEGLTDKVTLTGKVSDSLLAALYQRASVFVFPSLAEGFGFPPLEAMHYGVPVAASTAPCIPETLGEAPLYFDPRDVAGMANAIHRLITDEKVRRQLISAGADMSRKYSWDKTARETWSAYRSLTGRCP
ncbi:MAG: glycosyltransferase family 4 protein [Thermoleophilia bacterium]|nr:glycosyltransferase family 4 protein [Thermoleophilia bacterium]